MDDAQRGEVIASYIAAYNRFDIEGMAALLAPDICFENHSAGERLHATQGIDAFLALANSSKALFAERAQQVTSLRFEPDSVLASIEFRGKLAADIPDGPSAGTVLELRGTSRFCFEDGRISKLIDEA